MLSIETCVKLKTAGWPQDRIDRIEEVDDFSIPVIYYTSPTLEELLEAVDGMTTKTLALDNAEDGWTCSIGDVHQTNGGYGFTDPSEAVAALWLKLKGDS